MKEFPYFEEKIDLKGKLFFGKNYETEESCEARIELRDT